MDKVTPESIEEREELYNKYYDDIKDKLNEKIINNTKFEELFHKELIYFFRKTQSLDFSVEVAPDNNSVSITSYKPVVDLRPEFRDKNKSFLKTIFTLKDDNLVCDYNQGVLFNRKDLEENGIRTKLEYEAKLETNYAMKFFDKDGIEYSDNSYSDVYHFDEEKEDLDIREITMSSFHKPVFNEYKFANIPIHVMRGKTRNTYRKMDSLAVIHSNIGDATPNGYKNILCALFTCHPSLPEMLRGSTLFGKSDENNNGNFKFNMIDNYASDFDEAYKKAKEEYIAGIEESNIKEYNERIYNAIMSKLQETE